MKSSLLYIKVPVIITTKPITLTMLTHTFKDYKDKSGFPSADKVIIIPTIQMTPVFVTFKRDLVNASNIFVIFKPFKLNMPIDIIP